MKKQKTKISGKTVAVAAAAFLGLAVLFGGGSEPEQAEPTRAAETAAPTEATTPEPTPTPEPTATPYRIRGFDPQRTVYVSSSGLIHLKADCSGMVHYEEMTLEAAVAAGHDFCARCFD